MRVLLISDESMNVNGGGFPQTLHNVFSFIKPENILLITSSHAYKSSLPSAPFTARTITYNFELIHPQKNRLGSYINKTIDWINYSINYKIRSFKRIRSAIQKFNPDVVIVAPNEKEGLFMYYKLKPAFEGIKTVPYFMDDWLRDSSSKWLGGNIHSLAKKVLNENRTWLMISKNLGNILGERYKVNADSILEIHNPVELNNIPERYSFKEKDEYTIAYAGALWPMHYDAFLVMAKAIKLLSDKIKIKLIVYTAPDFWNWRKNDLEPLLVIYGGNISYQNIHRKLAEADFLLLTSSFSKKFYTHSSGSIQTKLTDYLKTGRLIIACGPSYSANHDFLKKYNCGICIETTDENDIAGKLNKILEEPSCGEKYISNGFRVLKEELSFEKVHQKLKAFLETGLKSYSNGIG